MSVITFTITVLVVYLAALKIISFIACKNSESSTADYFLSNRNVGTFAIIATTMASIFSTATVVGSPSEFYSKGVNFFWFFSFGACVFFVLPLVFRFWALSRTKGYITPGDLTGDFYQSKKVQIVTALIGLIALFPYAIAQIIAVGKTFEALTGGVITYTMGVSIVSLAIGLYLYFGGSRAVILTDVIQGIIFASLIFVSGWLCLYWSDGWNNLASNLLAGKSDAFSFHPTVKYYENILLAMTFYFLPHVWQRMYMARTSNMLAKNLCAMPFVILFLYTATALIGFSGYTLLNPEALQDSDNLLGGIFNIYAPYFGSFVLVAAFAAGMSTIDSQLLTSAALITRDILPRKLFKDDFAEFKAARYITVAILLLCFSLALILKNQSTFALVILGISLTPIMAPTVYGMFFWKRATAAGALTSLLSGLAIFLLHAFTPLKAWSPAGLGAVSWSFLTATISFVVVSLFTDSKRLENKREEYLEVLDLLNPKIKREELKIAANY